MCYTVIMMEVEEKFENYIELFNRGVSVKKIKPLKNQTYKVFADCKDDIRVIDRDKNLKLLSFCKKIKRFTVDTKKSHRYFYALPIQSPNGEYVGFIFRTLFEHDYASVYRPFKDADKKVPYFYGFFKDFQDYNRHTTCMPILVCESAKDAIVFKKMYPYTIACNTSSLGIGTHILANITDKILLAYDNDSTGVVSTKRDKRTLTRLGCSVDVLQYHDGFKDISDYVSHPQEMREIKEQVKSRIDGLVCGSMLTV